jgi:hypothetical protein
MVHDWDIRLANYVDSVRYRGFDWSEFDCLVFANGAAQAQLDRDVFDDWIGDYNCYKSAYKHYKGLLKKYNEKSIITAIDGRLNRVDRLMPMRGNIVARGHSDLSVVGITLGVAVSDVIAFVGYNGLEFFRPTDGDIYWSVS